MPPKIDTRTYFVADSEDAARNRKARKAGKRPIKPTLKKYLVGQYNWYFEMREEFGTQNKEEVGS